MRDVTVERALLAVGRRIPLFRSTDFLAVTLLTLFGVGANLR